MVVCKFLRVIFGVTNNPSLLGGTTNLHVLKYFVGGENKDFLKKLLREIRVDINLEPLMERLNSILWQKCV